MSAVRGGPLFDYLQIYDSRERWMVGGADAVLACAALSRLWRPRPRPDTPARILLLRLERIGDLLMTLGAIEAIRQRAPHAEVHLVVGSWNDSIARLVPAVSSVEILDVPWLARGAPGATAGALVARARAWRARRFDLAINFEPDIRTNGLLALSGASRRVGYRSGGGGALLTDALDYDARAHTAANAERLVDAACPAPIVPTTSLRHPRLVLPDAARLEAGRHLPGADPGRPLVGLHASGGRVVKQWHPDRFALVAAHVARRHGATIVLTGTPEERDLVERVRASIPPDVPVVDAAVPMTLPVFGALLERLRLLMTGDTGPMHMAAAIGTPVVALFGPSDPGRYGPLTDRARVVTVDLWCRPCNRVRTPPSRCAGRVPDCLDGIDVDRVCRAVDDLLRV